MAFYPLATGNKWNYIMKTGVTYSNEVIASDGNLFTMKNSLAPIAVQMRKEDDAYQTNHWDGTNFQVLLKDSAAVGDSWEVKFMANGLECFLTNTVKETAITKEVKGTTYNDVMMIEGESKVLMNGNLIPLNHFTQFYYADGVGLILTTTSAGDEIALSDYSVN